MNQTARDKLARLLTFLEVDPGNPVLLKDAAETAVLARDWPRARQLVDTMVSADPAGFAGRCLDAVVAMGLGELDRAEDVLEHLMAHDPQPIVRLNLAMLRIMRDRPDDALALLDDACIAQLPDAARLRVQLVHKAGDAAQALTTGRRALLQFPDDSGLTGAVATAALDMGDLAFAAELARRGGDNADALAVAGALSLRQGSLDAARAQFQRSIGLRDNNPRALVGQGLVAMMDRDMAGAMAALDRAAGLFDRHIGSWIAAGWAHFLAGDVAGAQGRFERALAIDDNFGESHGALAVIDLVNGDRDAGLRKMKIASRLDPKCFSVALARVMLAGDDPERARQIVERAMTTPIGDSDLTLMQMMVAFGTRTVH